MIFHSTFKNSKKFNFYMLYFLLTFYTASTLIAFTSPANAIIKNAIIENAIIEKATIEKAIIEKATIEDGLPVISKQPSESKCTHGKAIIYAKKPITQEPNSINRVFSTPVDSCKPGLICLYAAGVTGIAAGIAAGTGTICAAVHGYSASLALHASASALTSISSSIGGTGIAVTCNRGEEGATISPKELTACCCAGFTPSIIGTGVYLGVVHGVGCGYLRVIAPSIGGALSMAGQYLYVVLCRNKNIKRYPSLATPKCVAREANDNEF